MIDVIVGGQFGSEGKGKVTYILANESIHKCVARIGGPNSGHTVKGKVLRQLPVSVLIDRGVSIIGAGSYIDVNILEEEISIHKPKNLYIDSKAVVIRRAEKSSLRDNIGSTLTGTGEGVYDRVSRNDTIFIKSYKNFAKYIVDTEAIQDVISKGCIVEGSQGFGLSNIHTPYYPYCTSRDTTAAGFISELGVSPLDVRNIYLVIRTYPIRVAGNSGPLPFEISWEHIGVAKEYTSVTKKVRRVGEFDPEIVRKAIRYNKPTHIILNHLDYIHSSLRKDFVESIEISIKSKIDYIGLDSEDLCDRSIL